MSFVLTYDVVGFLLNVAYDVVGFLHHVAYDIPCNVSFDSKFRGLNRLRSSLLGVSSEPTSVFILGSWHSSSGGCGGGVGSGGGLSLAGGLLFRAFLAFVGPFLTFATVVSRLGRRAH